MALTPSSMLPLGTPAFPFTLRDTVSGQDRSLEQLRGRHATLLMFICNHCPYVKHVNPELVRLARDYQPRGVGFVAISANDAQQYPEDAPGRMQEMARALAYPFPYLHDETQSVARAYRAACTPDFFLFDAAPGANAGGLEGFPMTPAAGLHCVYRGQLDASRPNNGLPVTGADLRSALDAVLANRTVNPDQKPSVGCNIKWKS